MHTKVLKLRMKYFYKSNYLRTIPVIVVSVGIGALATIVIPQSGWLFWGVKGIIVVLIYTFLAFLFSLDNHERKWIYMKLFRRIQKNKYIDIK